ncbi:uncharacterized protein LOC120675719 [Panicum virgatum]|uniref:DUF4283 domain-containing protein n=1 Tax=Panicum virgatum TaxID=38727 RepID=A0A8T0RLL2_PANVG|nr:uncharacterized protein LOC120675719 [Panicum virgatum]KAG2586030.1 hypothetical protein PVAP13_5NG001100 [Panicum virgatum]
MPAVAVAPSIKQALRRITAKDSPRPQDPDVVHRRFNLGEFHLFSSAKPRSMAGKFWDSDSESDYEDLGDADSLAMNLAAQKSSQDPAKVLVPTPPPHQPRPAAICRSAAGETAKQPGTNKMEVARPVRPPWKQLWKGPLPPPRITPPVTLGQFLPEMKKTGKRRADPIIAPVRIPNLTGPTFANAKQSSNPSVPNPGPHQAFPRLGSGAVLVSSSAATSALAKGNPRRRLISPTVPPHLLPPKPTYRDVLMAGRGRWFRRRNSPGRGSADRQAPADRQVANSAAPGRNGGQPGRGRGNQARSGRVDQVERACDLQADRDRGVRPDRGRGRGAPHAAGGNGGPNAPTGRGTAGVRGGAPLPPQAPAAGDQPSSGSGSGEGNQRHGPDQGREASEPTAEERGKSKRKRSGNLECTICLEDHFTNQCHLLRGPKPSVTYCGAAEDGMGFFQIQAANLNDIVASDLNSAAAQITVESGEVSSRLLVTELSRLVPVHWKWEVQELDSHVFVVPFPSKEELDRLVAVGTVTTKNKEGTLLFEEFVDDVQPIKVLDKVWVTVTKVPRLLRSFLPLWAVGTIIGETQKVDIYHLRQTGEVRILVAVFDVQKIPKYADVCVKGSIYRLYFKPDEVAPKIFNPEDDDLLGDDDKDLDGDGDREMEEADDAPKPQDFEKGKSTSASDGTLPSHSQSGAYHKQAALIQEAIDLACEQLFEEISIKVMVEKEGGEEWKRYSPLTEEELATYNSMITPPIKPHPFMFADEVVEAGGELNPSLGFDGGLPLLSYPASPVADVEEDVTLHPPTPPSLSVEEGLGGVSGPLPMVGQPIGAAPLPSLLMGQPGTLGEQPIGAVRYPRGCLSGRPRTPCCWRGSRPSAGVLDHCHRQQPRMRWQLWGRPLLLRLPNSADVAGMWERRMSTPYTR